MIKNLHTTAYHKLFFLTIGLLLCSGIWSVSFAGGGSTVNISTSSSLSGSGTACEGFALPTVTANFTTCGTGGGASPSTFDITWYYNTTGATGTTAGATVLYSQTGVSTGTGSTVSLTLNDGDGSYTGLTQGTYYIFALLDNPSATNCGFTPEIYTGNTGSPAVFTLVVDEPGVSCHNYCASSPSNSNFEWISNVSFGDIDQASGGSNYQDNTGSCFDFIRGTDYDLCVNVTTTGAYTEHVWAYFDWNNDGDFSDAGESYDLGQVTGSGQLCQTITIPAGADLASIAMRIIDANPSDPPSTGCYNGTYGETEDYCITLIDCTTTVPNAGTDQTLSGCANSTNLAGNTITQGTGFWVLVSGAGDIDDPFSPTSLVTNLGPGTNTFEWQVTDDPCPTLSDQVDIINNNLPTIANAGEDLETCSGSFALSANSPGAGETGAWSCTSGCGNVTSGLPSTNPNQTFTLSGGAGTTATLTWTLTKGSCTSSDDIVLTIISGVTPADAGSDQPQVCYTAFGDGSTGLEANTPVVGSGSWTVVSNTTGGTVTDLNDPSSTVTGINATGTLVLDWTISGAGCASSTDQVTITTLFCTPDEPCFAQGVAVTPATCSFSTYNNVGMTFSTGMPEATCGAANGPDVWFSAVVPSSGQLQISAASVGGFDPMVSVYDGPCSALEYNGCVYGGGSNAFPLTYAGTPGSTVYIRVNEYGGGDAAEGSFDLCVYEATTATISEVLPGDTTTITCGSTLNFYDPGGQGGTTSTSTAQPPPAGNYTNNTGAQWVICPDDPSQYVQINFNEFTVENGFDKVIIMSADTVIAQWTGDEGQGDIVTSIHPGECLTVVLQSDYIWTAEGWEAVVSCTNTPVAAQIANACEVRNCNGGCGIWICADGIYDTQAGAGAGIDEVNEVTGGCWGAAGEVATSWFYFTVAADGSLEFEFVPSNNGHNINFALYGPSTDGVPPCPLSTGDAPIRCSFATAGGINTGLQAGQTDWYDGGTGDGMAAPLDVVAGETYALVVDVYQNGQPPTETEIDFTGAAALDCTVLPITLSEFYGMNQGDMNVLSWITQSEYNNDYFTIYRSVDGKNWQEVGIQDGAGTSQQRLFYKMNDYNPYYPVTYYRLKQTDFDGKEKYSDVISISTLKDQNQSFITNLFPNPTSDYATFSYSGNDTKTPLNVRVINTLGEVVMELNYKNLYKNMPATLITDQLSEGLYQVEFTQGTTTETRRLAIIR